jgi:DNA polymerase (family 10)
MFTNPILENLYMQQCRDDMSITTIRVPKVKAEEKRYPRQIITDMLPMLHFIFDDIGKWEIVGSYRRGKADFKDIDIIVIASKEQFAKIQETTGVSLNIVGGNIIRGKIKGYDIDINRCDAENYESMKLFRTGSMEHNIKMRTRAKNLGMKLNEYGLFRGDTLIANESEKAIFDALGMKYLEPSER